MMWVRVWLHVHMRADVTEGEDACAHLCSHEHEPMGVCDTNYRSESARSLLTIGAGSLLTIVEGGLQAARKLHAQGN